MKLLIFADSFNSLSFNALTLPILFHFSQCGTKYAKVILSEKSLHAFAISTWGPTDSQPVPRHEGAEAVDRVRGRLGGRGTAVSVLSPVRTQKRIPAA